MKISNNNVHYIYDNINEDLYQIYGPNHLE